MALDQGSRMLAIAARKDSGQETQPQPFWLLPVNRLQMYYELHNEEAGTPLVPPRAFSGINLIRTAPPWRRRRPVIGELQGAARKATSSRPWYQAMAAPPRC
jgi:hypothetical protein